MGSWFWLNFPLALLFFGAWTAVPLWLVLTRWRREIEAKHAEIAALAAAEVVVEHWEQSASDDAAPASYEAIAD
jgi:cell division protein FtsB